MNEIGTLSEKSIHSYLKDYFEQDKNKHEIKILGYVADISNQSGIIEIQSKDFSKLRRKLDTYLVNGIKTRIVYPVSLVKYINWVDPVTHKILERRKSPSKSSIYDIFIELYRIRDRLRNPLLAFTVVTLETEEYKYLDGYGPNGKNHATKIDKIPAKVMELYNFSVNGGFEIFIPDTLPNGFTSSDFRKNAHCSLKAAQNTLLILSDLGICKRVGRDKRGYIYSR